MSEFIKKQCVVRNNGSHFALHVEYANEILQEEDTAGALHHVINLLETQMVEMAGFFKEKMAKHGYKWVEIYEMNRKLEPAMLIHDNGSLGATLSGDLHAPFDEECVRKACEEAGIELFMVNEK